jgi:predicted glycoside hydrolase/deacetylase ChbG (UPF0249 family)
MDTPVSAEKRLIINADDLGMCHSINDATFAAMVDGIVTSASAMVPCPSFPEAANFAAQHPEIDIGIHLTLTSEWPSYRWAPVAPTNSVRSLVGVDGYFLPDTPSLLRQSRPEEIELEIRAQIEYGLECGLTPSHLDCHMDVLFTDPVLHSVLVRVAGEYSLSTISLSGRDSTVPTIPKSRVFQVGARTLKQDWNTAYERILENLPDGISILVVHLGSDNSELAEVTAGVWPWGAAWRALDTDVLRSERFTTRLTTRSILPSSWSDLTMNDAASKCCSSNFNFQGCHGADNGIDCAAREGLDYDWTAMPTTIDQSAVENALENIDLQGKNILHVGAGNSSLAARFSRAGNRVDALTLSLNEYTLAKSLGLPNYTVHVRDKYRPRLAAYLACRYDIIADNNIASFACCLHHLDLLLREYISLLNPGGFIVTDRRGMDWWPSGQLFRIGSGVLLRMFSRLGLQIERHTPTVYFIGRPDD